MKYLVTSEEMKEYDNHTSEKIGVPALVLMERAALAVRDEILKVSGENFQKNVLIVTGSGNNGADGLALARLLTEYGYMVSVYECGNIRNASPSYKKQREILTYYDVRFLENMEVAGEAYDFIVDGIFGVGLSRNVNEAYSDVINRLNQMSGMKVAIDIPSGIDGTTGEIKGCAFRADVTVTFGFGKRGLYLFPGTEYAGKVVTARIGIDERSFFGKLPQMFTYDESPAQLMPVRRPDGNKGTFGKVLVIAGWENMAGAAIMCAKAVLRTGAGMVKVFCSEQNRGILQCAVPEAMYGNRESLKQDLKWADIIAAGPGLGKSEEAAEMLEILFKETKGAGKQLILDADALNLLAEHEELRVLLITDKKQNNSRDEKKSVKKEKHSGNVIVKKRRIIMTPHMGELARLSRHEISYLKSHVEEVAKALALDYDSVMVCKDARTIVYDEGQPVYLNTGGNSGMATAGSGDVLTGIIGALLAQGCEPFRAACTGVYLHGLAGDAAASEYTEYGVTATGIIAQIEGIMKGS